MARTPWPLFRAAVLLALFTVILTVTFFIDVPQPAHGLLHGASAVGVLLALLHALFLAVNLE